MKSREKIVRSTLVFAILVAALAGLLFATPTNVTTVHAADCNTANPYAELWTGPFLNGTFLGRICDSNSALSSTNGIGSIKFFKGNGGLWDFRG
jgi:hypothetical protein